MRILANENMPLASVQLLRAAGFDVKAVGIDMPGIADQDVLRIAVAEQRTIVTFDRDYGELIFRHGHRPPCGVIYLRWRRFRPDDPGRYLVDLLRSTTVDFGYALTVIDEDTIRQRRYSV